MEWIDLPKTRRHLNGHDNPEVQDGDSQTFSVQEVKNMFSSIAINKVG